MRPSRDALLLIGLLICAVVFAMTTGSGRKSESPVSTSYDNGANGVKAVYTLLGDRLGYNVDRLFVPYTDMPKGASVLVVVEPLLLFPISGEEGDALKRWIRAGGTAVFVSDSLENVPARFGSNRRIGKGFVYAINSKRVITNKGVRDYRNALKIVSIVADRATRGDLVLFDEYHHGLGRSEVQSILLGTERHIKIGGVVIAVALLLLCYGRGRRFGAVRNLPSYMNRRPEFEYVESIGRLYERAGATDVAAGILLNSLRQGMCIKLGLSPDAPRELIVQRMEHEGRKDTARITKRLLAPLQAGHKMSKSELLNVAREIHSVEKELGIVGSNG